jgi:glutathione peroxidase
MVTTLALLAMMNIPNPAPNSIYDFTMKDIDGKPQSLKKFKGKVVLVVNVASKCGLTPQYAGLQAMYKKYEKDGLVVLGFPANNFGGQEPGSEEEIKTFCTTKYEVSFPMFSKISVKGDDIAPLYKWLLEKSGDTKDIEWNFGKFLVNRDGSTVQRFSPRDVPASKNLEEAIVAALKK